MQRIIIINDVDKIDIPTRDKLITYSLNILKKEKPKNIDAAKEYVKAIHFLSKVHHKSFMRKFENLKLKKLYSDGITIEQFTKDLQDLDLYLETINYQERPGCYHNLKKISDGTLIYSTSFTSVSAFTYNEDDLNEEPALPLSAPYKLQAPPNTTTTSARIPKAASSLFQELYYKPSPASQDDSSENQYTSTTNTSTNKRTNDGQPSGEPPSKKRKMPAMKETTTETMTKYKLPTPSNNGAPIPKSLLSLFQQYQQAPTTSNTPSLAAPPLSLTAKNILSKYNNALPHSNPYQGTEIIQPSFTTTNTNTAANTNLNIISNSNITINSTNPNDISDISDPNVSTSELQPSNQNFQTPHQEEQDDFFFLARIEELDDFPLEEITLTPSLYSSGYKENNLFKDKSQDNANEQNETPYDLSYFNDYN